MSILDSFFILFEGDTSKLDKGVEDADKKGKSLIDRLHGVDDAANKTGTGFLGMMKQLAGVAGVTLSVGLLAHAVGETAKQYQQLGMLAARFRSTTDEIDNFLDVSGLLGISEEKATESLTALTNAMTDASMGFGRAQKVFAELHIPLKDAQGHMRSTTGVLSDLQKKIGGMDRGKQIRIMERLGLDPALLKLFNTDLGALKGRLDDIDRATGFDLDTAVRRSQDYTKASKEMGVELRLLKTFIEKMSEAMQVAAMPYFTAAMTSATKYVRMFTEYLMRHAPFVQGVFIAIGAAITAYLIPSAIRGALAVWTMMAPFALVGALVFGLGAAFALLYDDVVNFMQGNDSLIGSMLKKWPLIGEIFHDIGAVLKFVGEVARDVGRILWAELGIAWEAVAKVAGEALEWIEGKLASVGEALGPVSKAFVTVGHVIAEVFEWVWQKIAAVWDKVGGIVGIASKLAGGIRAVLGHAKNDLDIHDEPQGAQTAKAAPKAGQLPAQTAAAVAAAKVHLQAASTSPLTSMTSNSIVHGGRSVRGGDRNVKIDKIEVQTQATDAQGVAAAIGGTLGNHLRNASSQFDDGVAA